MQDSHDDDLDYTRVLERIILDAGLKLPRNGYSPRMEKREAERHRKRVEIARRVGECNYCDQLWNQHLTDCPVAVGWEGWTGDITERVREYRRFHGLPAED